MTADDNSIPFQVISDYEPRGDQPAAIEQLSKGVSKGMRHQTLLGVTGSGKTYTMAKVTESVQKPTLVIAPNKTLAAQLAAEFADGLMISVKDPKEAYERVIEPSNEKAKELGKDSLRIHTYRWTVFADNDDDAWKALGPWRGLRAPGRLEAKDPAILREAADTMEKSEILSKYSIAGTVEEIYDIYKPLVSEFNSEIITIQITSTNQEETIKILGEEVLPSLKKI